MPEPSASFPHLFSSFRIRDVVLRNRTAMLPMGSRHPKNGMVSEADLAWHEERARGGVGLIITGGTVVHPTSFGRNDGGGGLIAGWREEGLEMQKRRVDAIHRHGARVFSQFLHQGRDLGGGQSDSPLMGPSAVRSPREESPPHALTREEIRDIVRGFGKTARLAQQAGYDGLEIHAAHGYLIANFLSLASNRRSDEYGVGSYETRMRFLTDILEEVRSQCGSQIPMGVRLSADEEIPDGLTTEQTLRICERLQKGGLIDYLSITVGVRSAYVKDNSVPHGVALKYAAAVKREASLPVLVAGRITSPELAERAVAEGMADLIGMGRALIADPELPSKAGSGRVAEIRPCVGFAQDCRMSMGGATCAVNGSAGREVGWSVFNRAPHAKPRKYVVVGGGPGGMEAARLAAERGHAVVLYEAENRLGGQLLRLARAPYREEFLGFARYLEHEVKRLGADLRLGTIARAEDVLAEAPDTVILATGSMPESTLTGAAGTTVLRTWDVLDGQERKLSGHALLVDDGTGFWQGCSTAEFLLNAGLTLEFATPAPAIGLAIPHESIQLLHGRLRRDGAVYSPFTRFVAAAEGGAIVADTVTGAERHVAADVVVVQVGNKVNDGLLEELRGRVEVFAIGDALAPRRITHAVLDANSIVRTGAPTNGERLTAGAAPATIV